MEEALRQTASSTAEALVRLSRAAQRLSMYPASHPSVPGALAAFLEVLREGDLAFDVTSTAVLVGGAPLEGQAKGLAWLAQRLYERGVASVNVKTDLDEGAALRFVEWLAAPRGSREAAPLDPGLTLTHFDYASARFTDAPAEREAQAEGLRYWKALLPTLAAGWYIGDPDALPADPSALAKEFSSSLARSEGVGASGVAGRLTDAASQLRRLPAGVRAVVRKRLASFVAGLGDELRAQILKVDAAAGDDRVEMLEELAEDLPDTAVMDVLSQVDHQGGRVPARLFSLFGKLIGLAGREPALKRAAESKLDALGMPRSLIALQPEKIREVLAEVMTRRSEADWTPEAYRQLLEDVARRPTAGRRRYDAARLGDPSTSTEVRMHLGEVALQLLLNQPEAQEAPDCLRRIDETAPLLLAARRFDVVEETLRALKDLLLLEAYLPTEVAQLTRGCLDGFASEERIGLVLDAAVGGEAPPSAPLVGLFRAGGEAAVEAALARLASAPDERIRSRLVELIVAAEPDVFKAAVARVRSEGGEGLRLLFLVFRHPKAAGGVEFAATFAGNKDPGVRLEAFRVLFEADPRAGQHDRYVQRALSDRDPRVAELGVEQALKEPEVTAVRLLSRFLEETLSESDPARTRRAASALAELGSAAGREALARLLRARRMQLRPSQVRLSQALGAALARNPDPETAKAIREFRRSPAGWMSWLLGPQTEAA